MKKLMCMVVILITVAYVSIGGVVFHVLEADNESDVRSSADGFLLEFMDNNTCVTMEELRVLLRMSFDAYQTGHLVANQTESASNWDYYSSIFFAITVITTIGYGNISPSTVPGRIFCVVFALVGIPLFLLTASAIGERLYWVIKKAQKCCFRLTDDGERKKSAKICGSVFYVLLGIGIFLIIPAVIFMYVEEWSIGDGLYYSVITLTTVGFGDYVAGTGENNKYFDFRGIYRLCVAGWIVIGLSWMAGVISAIQEFYSKPHLERDQDANSKSSPSRRSSEIRNRVAGQDLRRMYSMDSGYAGANGIKTNGVPYDRQASYDSVYNNTLPQPNGKLPHDSAALNIGNDDTYLTKL